MANISRYVITPYIVCKEYINIAEESPFC